ncbi:FHIPEP family type III secretion protein [bacterium]|nr:FHIPEP family type III secretion protein [bacterium]
MFKDSKVQYVIRTCPSEDVEALQNLLNEMSKDGWELYAINEVEVNDGDIQYNCIFMRSDSSFSLTKNIDEVSISNFKSQMEKLLSPKLTPYEKCVDIQMKLKEVKNKINKAKKELEKEDLEAAGRKRLNNTISSGLKEMDDLKRQLAETTSPDGMYKNLSEDKLVIRMSEEIIGYIDPEQDIDEEELIAETVKLRVKLTDELGYIIPKIIFKDDESLNPYEFAIRIRGIDVLRANVYPGHLMFFADDLNLAKKSKDFIYDTDVITDKKIVWVPKDKCKDFWEQGLSGAQCITRALEFVTVKHVDDLLDYKELDKYIDVVEKNNEFLVDNLVPNLLSFADLRYIITGLINERISIKDITYIFEKINDLAGESEKDDILRKLRLSLGSRIAKRLSDETGVVKALEITEDSLIEICDRTVDEDEYGEIIKIDAKYADKLAKKIAKLIKKYDCNTVLVPLEFRYLIYKMLSCYFNEITVTCREEISFYAPIEVYEEL